MAVKNIIHKNIMPQDLHPDDQVPFYRRMHPALKAVCLVFVIVLPVFLLCLVMAPILLTQGKPQQTYSLSPSFSQKDLSRFVEQLRDDAEYQFYFSVMSNHNISRAVAEVYRTVGWTQGKDVVQQQIVRMQGQLEKAAVIIKAAAYPQDFAKNPLAYPDLVYGVWSFLYEEFKLTITGVCYQSLYDKTFFFVWSNDAQQAARHIQTIVRDLSPQQRQDAENLFLERKNPRTP